LDITDLEVGIENFLAQIQGMDIVDKVDLVAVE
jgi:hypothetical protein